VLFDRLSTCLPPLFVLISSYVFGNTSEQAVCYKYTGRWSVERLSRSTKQRPLVFPKQIRAVWLELSL
jgi:hypothetical protein